MVLHSNPNQMIPVLTEVKAIASLGIEDGETILDILGVTKHVEMDELVADIPNKDIGPFLGSLHMKGSGNTAIVVGNYHEFKRAASNSLKATMAEGRLPIVHEELLLTSRTLQISNILNLNGGTYNAASLDEVEEFFDIELGFHCARDDEDDSLILRAPYAAKPGRINIVDGTVFINGMQIKDTALIWSNSGSRWHPLAQKVLGMATPQDILRILMVVLKAACDEGKSHKQLLGYLAGLASASAPGEHELSKLDADGIRYRTTNVMGVLVLRTRPAHYTTFAQPSVVNLIDAAEEMMLVDPYSLYTVTEKGEDLIRFTVEELLSGDNVWGLKLEAPKSI